MEFDRDVLHDLYVTQQLSTTKIANKLGVGLGTINRALDYAGIKKRPGGSIPRTNIPYVQKQVSEEDLSPEDDPYSEKNLSDAAKGYLDCSNEEWMELESQLDNKISRIIEKYGKQTGMHISKYEIDLETGVSRMVFAFHEDHYLKRGSNKWMVVIGSTPPRRMILPGL